jgi:hypothetical protein
MDKTVSLNTKIKSSPGRSNERVTSAGSDEYRCENCGCDCGIEIKIIISYILDKKDYVKEFNFCNVDDYIYSIQEIIDSLKNDFMKAKRGERKMVLRVNGCITDKQQEMINSANDILTKIM